MIIDIITSKIIKKIKFSFWISNLILTTDGNYLILISNDCIIHIYDLRIKKKIQILSDLPTNIKNIALPPNNTNLICLSDESIIYNLSTSMLIKEQKMAFLSGKYSTSSPLYNFYNNILYDWNMPKEIFKYFY